MQEKTTIARPYAQAAFAQASEENKLQQWSDLLRFLGQLTADPTMIRVTNNPKLGRDKLVEIICDLCGDRLFDSGRNFITLLADADRLLVVPEICTLFEMLHSEAEGIVNVTVIAAYDLDEAQQSKIKQSMAKRLGKDVQITSHTDQSLIGGAVIRAGDSVIDASIRGRLKQLSQNFAE